ncbi:ComF family protein [Nocardioides gilvus]|uniref:ComF family protein n=1 Tax=Nocardioides gilvus TaxID=1735589 RepID=UPI000D74A072|nr:ComF family protein [Nocardioides gilvus]
MLIDALVDLALGSHCVECGQPGRLACPACTAGLSTAGISVRPDPPPPGLVECWASGTYDGLLRRAVIGHKEDGLLGLSRLLGERLALAVRDGLHRTPGVASSTGVVLVPVPSRPGADRARGDDPLGRLVRIAARQLRAEGVDVRAMALLRSRGGVRDQAGLDARARTDNLAGSMRTHRRTVERLAVVSPRPRVVLCDDVLTTGATAREGQRALTASGVPVSFVAVVAAVERQLRPSRPVVGDPKAGGFLTS